MFFFISSLFVSLVLKLRYRIRLHGLDEIMKKGGGGILFLPNHPALIDPVIVASILYRKFRPRVVIEEKQVRETVLKHFVKELRMLPIPDLGVAGQAGAERVRQQLREGLKSLRAGENVLMYPSGHIYHSRFETLRGNTGAHFLLSEYPEVRVVLVRTQGLWGSSFSRGCGYQRPFTDILNGNFKHLLQNLIFFSPRREVDVTFAESPSDMPRPGTKEQLNRYLESFYNTDVRRNTYVPYTWWEKGGTRTLPEPPSEDAFVDTREVPAEVKEKVYAKLREIASVDTVDDQDKLGSDLGMDSLMIFQVLSWVQQEFGQPVNNPESLKKVADVLLAAIGQAVSVEQLRPVPVKWFIPKEERQLLIPEDCPKVTDTYLRLASERPDFPLLADQNSGVLTNRKLILAISALRKAIAALPGDRVGIIMPACAPFFVVYMASLFAGKVPVLFNWTVGPRNLESCARRAETPAILTSQVVIEKLEGRGTDFSAIKEKFVYLEDLKKTITAGQKMAALLTACFCWRPLRKARVPDLAAILFTSGSESEPKVVPLSHKNCITDLVYAQTPMNLRRDDCILAMLPPFHSFGLLISALMPAVTHMRIVYHNNPMEGNLLAKIISAYQATMIVGTPTFAGGILKNGDAEQLKSVRLIITGAEKCPQSVLDLCHEKCPQASFLEGYGITECGPVVALNQPGACKLGTVGHLLKCLDWMVCDADLNKLPAGKTGMLYVSGDTVFGGYLHYDGASPFLEKDGKRWYRTGDLVQYDEEGFVTFMGRLKRFIKVAGEMVSLPAVEEVLLKKYSQEEQKGVPLAVEAQGPDDRPEIILFTILDLDKNEVNQVIREAGFSAIHYVKKVVKMAEIPLLGTGKTNYRALKNYRENPVDPAAKS